ncbi:MAG: hypothetical protein ACKOCX_03005, partial [Planctomycetota bacterium]
MFSWGLVAPCLAAEPVKQPLAVSFAEAAPATADTPQVTAIGLRAAAAPAPGPQQIIVLVDTSASQAGTYRERTLQALDGLLAAARREDRVAVSAVDVATVPLTEGFHGAGDDALRKARAQLVTRPPLGSTDLLPALEEAVARFDGPGPRVIVYIGDGPAVDSLLPVELAHTIDLLRAKQVAVCSFGIGPGINWQCLSSLAAHTGGMVVIPTDADDPVKAAERLAGFVTQPVLWPKDVSISADEPDAVVHLLPTRMPPLRADRDSIVLFAGPIGAELKLTLSGRGKDLEAGIRLPDVAPDQQHAYLTELARNSAPTEGLMLPFVGREGLALARQVIRGEAGALAALSARAEATGAHDAALRLAEASLRRDPDNQEATIIRQVARRQLGSTEEIPPPEETIPPADAVADVPGGMPADDELAEVDRQRRVRAQALEQDAAVRIREARQMLSTDPDLARERLKELQQDIRRSEDLDPAARERLLAQLEMRIRESIIRSREKTERDLAAERRAAIGRERLRMTGELQRREEKIKQLTEKYNALVEEGIRIGYAQAERYPVMINGEAVIGTDPPTRNFKEAERVAAEEIAREAPPLYANHPIPMTARVVGRTAPLVARILDYDTQNWRTRRDQERGFMDAMHLVDVAAIPFVDEPPIIYPDPDRWRALTKQREKYKSVDLANPGSKEREIYEALEKPVSNWEFNESPLRDVQRVIQDQFRIPVEIDARALEDFGLDIDTPVTQRASDISLRSALKRMLGPLDLAYLVKDEVLLITTREKAEENLVVKVYPVADLVMPVNPISGINPFQTGGGMGGMGGINSGMGMGMGGGMGGMGMGGMGGMGMCWVAREVYGVHDPRWLAFRGWVTTEAPGWFRGLYARHGEAVADWLHDKPAVKGLVRLAMN